MIRIDLVLMAMGVLSLAGCKPAERKPAAKGSDEAVTSLHAKSAGAPSGQIDPAPTKAPVSEVVRRKNIVVGDQPACALTVRYAGQLDQPVTWQGESCSDITVLFVSVADLAKFGQDEKITAETRDDIKDLPSGKVLYVEGEFSSAVYPANAMERVYEVPLAD